MYFTYSVYIRQIESFKIIDIILRGVYFTFLVYVIYLTYILFPLRNLLRIHTLYYVFYIEILLRKM